MSSPTARSGTDFRPDIEGLRGVAVLLVVVFHAALIDAPGGFIGVDVFFVISGFLITGLLLRERERTGRIGFRAFYARRVRRLLPAGLVALFATLMASFAVLPPLDLPSVLADGAAAALSVGNIRFALASGDYFASVATPSPVLHFWSLGVEEQFYLVWPAVLFLAARGRRPAIGVAVVLGLLIAASLAANLVLADAAVNWAFYSLPTRAWQLGVGGLLAVAARPLARVPSPILVIGGWLALAELLTAAAVFDGMLAYPGAAAVVPTLAAAWLIVSGPARLGPGLLLRIAPLRYLGRISYSLYLWHWPVLVLPVVALERELTLDGRLGLVGLSILLASLSWRFVEEPFRTGFPTLARRPGRTILAGATAVVLVVVTAGGLTVASTENVAAPEAVLVAETGTGPSAAVDDPGGGSPDSGEIDDEWVDDGAVVEVDGRELPVAPPEPAPMSTPGSTADSTPGGSPVPTAKPEPTATPRPVSWRLPRDVRPALVDARGDEERLRNDGCLAFEGATRPPDCVYGDRRSSFTVALVGDSHAAQWFPALQRVAEDRGWRILTFVKVACPFVDMPIMNISLKREYRECERFREATIARLRDVRPDLTLVSMSRFAIHEMRAEDATARAKGAALARLLERIPGRVAVIVDTPEAGRDVPSCLSRHQRDIRACAITRAVATSGGLGVIERLATEATGDARLNLTRCICPEWPCQVVNNGRIVFRDSRHLTATFSRSMSRSLERALDAVLER